MIIELFGPPGAGKTTFARALAFRLQQKGVEVELNISFRPRESLLADRGGECPSKGFVFRRFGRALSEIVALGAHPIANAQDVRMAMRLLGLMPVGPFSRLKRAQYLSRLSLAWRSATRSKPLKLFDQAFIQSVCSLAVESGFDEAAFRRALANTPRSDISIHLRAPSAIVASRLEIRHSAQSRLERSLEQSVSKSLAAAAVCDRAHAVLASSGRCVLDACSVDQASLDSSLDNIEEQVLSLIGIVERVA